MTLLPERPWRVGMLIGGKYALVGLVAEGGVGAVYEAQNTWTGRRVALKVLHPHYARQPASIKSFMHEAQAASRVEHPNVVSVLDMGQDPSDGTFYIVQEFLKGNDLRTLLQQRRLSPREALDVMVPIMGALVAMHRVGVVHRDVKPENIFLARGATGEMVPKLIDFGLAKVVEGSPTSKNGAGGTGTIVGTTHYMSPEQADGHAPIDVRTDVWSAGVVLYELLAGRCPYDAPTEDEVRTKILSEPAPRIEQFAPALPAQLAAAVHRALERDPAARFRSMAEFLGAVLDCEGVPDVGAAGSLRARHRLSLEQRGAGSRARESVETLPPELLEDPREHSIERVSGAVDWNAGADESDDGPEAERFAHAAEQSLDTNALDAAIALAERAAIAAGESGGETLGRARLVQAVAHRWRGHHAEAERRALDAMAALPPGSPGWFSAAGECAEASGALGRHERLTQLVDELGAHPGADEVAVRARVVAVSRLVIYLLRAGWPELVESVFEGIATAAESFSPDDACVRAWLRVVHGNRALHSGDPSEALGFFRAAASDFVEAGDARNACVQRANVSHAYMELGAYADAERVLREVLAAAEPMQLAFAAVLKSNLGLVLARLGALPQARAAEEEAVRERMRQGHQRGEGYARTYLAQILLLAGDADAAEREARSAAEVSRKSPDVRAYALAVLTEVLLARGAHADASREADEAFELLTTLGGVQEGEGQIRLAHAQALEATAQRLPARQAIRDARRRLLERAARVSDPEWRRSFLGNVPENAMTLALARRWLPDEPAGD